MSDAVEVYGDLASAGPFVFTCEHASNQLPAGFVATETERGFLADHWGWDIGSATLTRTLADSLGCQAILARYSRLVIDANRDTRDSTLILREIDGRALSFNTNVDAAERTRRIADLFEPYHAAIDEVIEARIALGSRPHLVAVHSFTPVYRGQPRAMEIGVLFNECEAEAALLAAELATCGLNSALNEPYSGKGDGALIYSAQSHARAHGIKYLELEVRQDLIDTAEKAREVANRIGAALKVFEPRA
jgi:predicted N-formylglutamate amidohydrolase